MATPLGYRVSGPFGSAKGSYQNHPKDGRAFRPGYYKPSSDGGYYERAFAREYMRCDYYVVTPNSACIRGVHA